jgi:sodium transport system ATP-binding protein
MIEATNLSKTFGDGRGGLIHAVRDVSFTVRPGEVYALIGPNGAGKTTLLRMLATILRPVRGTAVINGYDLLKEPDGVRASIGFLTGETGLYPRQTPWELIRFFGVLNGMSETEAGKRADELIELFDIREYRDRRCDHLSTGTRQKVSIARCVVHDPPVLIFDEPTSGLDVMVARILLDFISEMRQTGKCVLFSTHVMREAERLAGPIGLLSSGSLVAEGTLAELREKSGESDLEEVFLKLVRAAPVPLPDPATA